MANQSKDKNKLVKLSPKHVIFCERYLENGMNGAEAYRFAFKVDSIDNSRKKAHILLKDPLVSQYIKERQEELKEQFNINKEDIIMDLINIKNSNVADYLEVKTYVDDMGEPQSKLLLKDLDKLSLTQQRNIKSIKMTRYGVELVLKDSMDAIDKLLKITGMYNENITIDNRIDTSSLSNLSFEQLQELLKS